MKEKKNVLLVVEDDVKLFHTMTDFFEGNGYEVLGAMDGETALDVYFANNHLIDLVLLDGQLPKVDGYEVLQEIREYSDVPIIMVTARESEAEQLEGLEKGADNYITKPFRLSVLKAHVEILLKRKGALKEEIHYDAIRIDCQEQRVYVKDKLISLTPKEYKLLLYFVQKKNLVLTREMILDAVWGFEYDGDIRTVDTLVKQLRKKLSEECDYIHSIYGTGYRFEGGTHE